MNSIHIISFSFNDLGFRPLNWEQFEKLDKGKAIINENNFELYTSEGDKLSGTLSLTEVVDVEDWYAKEYIAKFNETGLNCFFSLCWQKLDQGLSSSSQLEMRSLVNPDFWYFYASVVNE